MDLDAVVNVQGRKGGGGGGTEAKDGLRSVQTAQLVDLLCEGEIKGLVNGLKSVYLDGVPVENADGSKNFENLSFTMHVGTQGQPALPGFDTVQNERAVGVTVTAVTSVVQTITNPSVDACRVTISVPQLTKLDPGSGDLNGDSFTFAIHVQSAGGGYVLMHQETIADKTTSNYKRAIRFTLPGSAPWDIRVSRLTPDSASSTVVNAFAWDSFTEIQSVALRYPNSVVAGLQVSARQFSRIPNRAFDVMGRIIRVPSNYDPIAGTYAGIWDGTFKLAWSNCPPWVYFDIATDPRCGVGSYIKDPHLDKWALYEIGRYCDVRVPDGQGGTEPRFTCNLYLQTAVQARQALQDLAGLFRAITYWGGGQIGVVQDAPADSRMLFNNSNIISDFAYESVSAKTRHSVWTVYYNDLSQLGKRVPAVYIDKDLVRLKGVVNETFSPIGCTSRGQAMRLAKWAALSEALGRTVTFRAGLNAVAIGPGHIIKISDRNKAGKRLGGRVRSATVNTVTLDAPVQLDAGQTYQLEVMLPDPTLPLGYKTEKRQVLTGEGEQQTLTVSPAFSVAPLNATIWVLQPTNIQPTWWRVIARREVAGSNEFDLVALAHDPDKFDAIEQGLKLAPKPTSGLSVIAPQVSSVLLTETAYMDGAQPRIRASVSWPEPGQGMRYRVTWRLNNGPWVTLPETGANAIDIDSLQLGTLEVTVQTINSIGRASTPVPASLALAGKVAPPANADGLCVLLTPSGWVQSWSEPPDADYSATEVRRDGINFDNAVFVFKGKGSQANLGWLSAATHTIRVVHWAGSRRSAVPQTNQIIVQAPGPATIQQIKQSVYSCEVVFADATTSQPLKAVYLRVGLQADGWETATALATAPGGARSWSVNLPKGNKRVFSRAEDAFGNLGAVSWVDLTVEGYSATELLDTLGNQLTTNQLNLALRTKIENIDVIGAAVATEISTRTGLTDGLSAQWVLKAQVVRGDGKIVFGGIGVSATSNGTISQSEILLTASRLTFVPDSDLSAVPVPLLTTGMVGGQQTVILRNAIIGDLAVTNRMVAGGITADKLITNGLIVRDDAGNPIFSANVKLVASRIEPAADWLNSRAGATNQIDLSWWKQDGASPWSPNGEYNRIVGIAPSGVDLVGVGPKGGSDLVWYCEEVSDDGGSGGGWNSPGLSLDPTKTYRFVVPIMRLSGSGITYWGTQNICNLNTTTPRENPYFAVSGGITVGRWYLFVGYVYPAGSAGNSHDSAGIWDCMTGAKVSAGENYCFKSGDGNVNHRAYQYYASHHARQAFGRPMVNLVDGTEPALREYFSQEALLNTAQQWSDVRDASGTRPANNATVGAAWGVNLASVPGNLAGLGGTEAIKNGDIGINSNGTLGGIGAGNGTVVVSNNQMTLSDTGQLYNAGAPQGQVSTITVVDIESERYINRPPSWYAMGTRREFKRTANIGIGDGYGYAWCTLETIKQFHNSGGGYPGYQYCYVGDYTFRRRATDDAGSGWTGWVQDLDRNAYTGDLNATNGATLGVNVGGKITPSNASTLIDNAALGAALIGELTTAQIKVTTVSRAINGIPEGSTQSGQRVEVKYNAIEFYNYANALRGRWAS